MTDTTRRAALGRGALALACIAAAPTAFAEERKTTLFKIVTVKDEIVIGLDAAELGKLGGADAGAVANAIKNGISERYDSLSGKKLGVEYLGMTCTVITLMLDGLCQKHQLKIKSTP